ncbi:MAG: hypothetical protein ACLP0J_02450 [Solirubrobacteraceae bacterium]
MARMTLRAVGAVGAVRVDGDRRQVPLSERIVDENLGSYCHVPQAREQLRSATADAGSSSRDQPSLLLTITTVILGMLKRLIRPRGARDVTATVASPTKRARMWGGLTQVGMPARESLAARLNGGLSRLAGAVRAAGARRVKSDVVV